MSKIVNSKKRKQYLKSVRRKKNLIILTQILVLISFLVLWELLANYNVIDSFITSKPSRIWDIFMNLGNNDLIMHIRSNSI